MNKVILSEVKLEESRKDQDKRNILKNSHEFLVNVIINPSNFGSTSSTTLKLTIPTWDDVIALEHTQHKRGVEGGIFRKRHLAPFCANTSRYSPGIGTRELSGFLSIGKTGVIALDYRLRHIGSKLGIFIIIDL
ncbi:hypothetical protein Tco_1492716 [Tanacetum coccineum]